MSGTLIAPDGGIAIRPDGGRAREDCCGCGGVCGAGCTLAEGEIRVFNGTGKYLLPSACETCVPFVLEGFSCCCSPVDKVYSGTCSWTETGFIEELCNLFKSKRNYTIEGSAVLIRLQGGEYRWSFTKRTKWAAWCGNPATDITTTGTLPVGGDTGGGCEPFFHGATAVAGCGFCEYCPVPGPQWQTFTVTESVACSVYTRTLKQVMDYPVSPNNVYARRSEFNGTVTVSIADASGCGNGSTGGKGGGGGKTETRTVTPTIRWLGAEWIGEPWPRRVWGWMVGKGWYRDGECGCWKRGKGWWGEIRRHWGLGTGH